MFGLIEWGERGWEVGELGILWLLSRSRQTRHETAMTAKKRISM